MSDGISRDYSFTVRLSPEEKAELETLAERFDLDKSATVRRALKQALSRKPALPRAGRFVFVQEHDVSIPIRLKGSNL